MNVARWTASSVREREVAEEAREISRSVRKARLAVLLVVLSWPLSCGLLGLSCLLWPLSLGTIVGAAWFARTASVHRHAMHNAAWLRDIATIDELGLRSGWLVKLIVRQGDTPTGEDRGMLWIEDDRLYFSGARTSFGLTGDQVYGHCELGVPLPGLRHEVELLLRARGPAGRLAVSFSPVLQVRWQNSQTSHDVCNAVDLWAKNSETVGGQLPPLDLGPSAPSRRRLFLNAALPLAYWTALATVAGILALTRHLVLSLVVLLVGLVIATFSSVVWVVKPRVQAYLGRRRLPEVEA